MTPLVCGGGADGTEMAGKIWSPSATFEVNANDSKLAGEASSRSPIREATPVTTS